MIRTPLAGLHLAAVFLTRLPLPPLREPLPSLASALWAFPWVGAGLGLLAGTALALAERAGLPPLAAALMALAVGILASGALHEDGLADVADAFAGGSTPARRLEILRDSRIGTYGALALVLSVGLRAAVLAALPSVSAAILTLVAAGALGRAAPALVLKLLPPARADGSGAAAGRPGWGAVGLALAGGAILAGACGAGAAVPALLAVLPFCWWARRKIGGQTGDVCGAAVQGVEILALLILSVHNS